MGEGCVTLGYSIIGAEEEHYRKYQWIDDIMENVAHQNELVFEEDVQKQTVGSYEKAINYIKVNPNRTRYSVIWCVDSWDFEE